MVFKEKSQLYDNIHEFLFLILKSFKAKCLREFNYGYSKIKNLWGGYITPPP